MITDGEKRHYLAIKSLSALLIVVKSNHYKDFYWLNCFHSYRTDNALKNHERLCNNHDYCHTEMLKKNAKILKYNHGEKSLKAPFIFTFYKECIIPKEQYCQNNPENSYTERKAKHEPSGWAMFAKCLFDATKNKCDY